MNQNLLHTPEGVRDIYGTEYERKLKLEELLHQVIRGYGYQDIQTPTIEFFDVFSREIGTTPSKELYKFFDKEGNTLVLRPDFTPSMARCAAKYFTEEEMPIRFSYLGNTFTNTSNLQGKLKEVTQLGAELIGDGSIEADAEMISMVVRCLLNTGLDHFQVSVGEVGYFAGICEAAGIDEETELQLREFISEKNIFGIEDMLHETDQRQAEREAFLRIVELFGGVEILNEAEKLVSNTRSLASVARLKKLYELLQEYGLENYVSFDLGMLSKYHYYTGIIFKAYTYGVGDAIVKGGRYDSLLEKFGQKAPATGFVVVVDDLMTALSSQKIDIPVENRNVWILYDENHFSGALKKAMELRDQGIPAEMQKAEPEIPEERYLDLAKQKSCSRCFYMTDQSDWERELS